MVIGVVTLITTEPGLDRPERITSSASTQLRDAGAVGENSVAMRISATRVPGASTCPEAYRLHAPSVPVQRRTHRRRPAM
jgi:hypothetical protein